MEITPGFTRSLRFRILAPLLMALILGMAISLLAIDWHVQADVENEVAEHAWSIQQLLDRRLEGYADAMAVTLEAMAHNPVLSSALQRRDRARLLSEAEGLFRELRLKLQVTHLYFSDPQRVNVLRVHAPDHSGDTIGRATTLDAEATGQLSWGLELGHFGILTLRVVAPWRAQGRLIGYVELGAEVDHLVRRIEKGIGSHLVLAIDKRFLQHARWQEGQRLLGLHDRWDLDPHWVLSGLSRLPIPLDRLPKVDSIIHSPPGLGPDGASNGRHYRWASLPVRDVEGRLVGHFLLLHDTSHAMHHAITSLLWVGFSSSLVGGLVILVLYLVSLRTEKQLNRSHQALQRAHDELELRVYERTRELSRSEEKYRELVERANSVILRWDPQGRITFFNEYAQRLFGFSEQEILGRHLVGSIVPRREEATGRDLEAMIAEIGRHPGRFLKTEVENIRKDGRRLWIAWDNRAVYNPAGEITEILSVGQDITERKRNEARIHFMAYYDGLTGLANRSLFQDRLRQALLHAKRQGRQLGLIYMDLDQFKEVNDSLGHAIGDRLLKQAARRLLECVREEDTVARMGGDEFTVIIGDLKPGEAVEVITCIAEKIKRRMEQAFEIDGSEMFVTASMGIVRYPVDGTSAEELTKHADTAMYHGKARGRNNYQLFETDMMLAARQRQRLEVKLRRALERREFYLRYQPLVELHGERVVAVEALLGWEESELGYVPPAEFVPVAESMGLIEPIGEWVLQKACRQFVDWREAAMEIDYLSINLSPRQIRQPGFAGRVERLLRVSRMQPRRLVMEITESVLISDPERAIGVFNELKGLGIRLAMDDFGTGYSSLSHLKQLPIDIVKIDRSFIRETPGDRDDVEIVTAIIAMSQQLKLMVVAEGIEQRDQKQFLQQLGCAVGQGFFYSKPLVADDLEAWMSKRQNAGPLPA